MGVRSDNWRTNQTCRSDKESRTIKPTVEIFDITTEELIQTVEVPNAYMDQLAVLMDWTKPEVFCFVYDLSPQQIKTIEEWTHTTIHGNNRIIQIVCIE